MALTALIVAIVAATVAFLWFAWSIGWSIYQHRQLTRGRLLGDTVPLASLNCGP